MRRILGELLDIFASNEYAAQFGESYRAGSQAILDASFADHPLVRRYCNTFFSMRAKLRKPFALLEAAEGDPGMYIDDGRQKPIQLWASRLHGTYPILVIPQRNASATFISSLSLIWTPATATLAIPRRGPVPAAAIDGPLNELRAEYRRWCESRTRCNPQQQG